MIPEQGPHANQLSSRRSHGARGWCRRRLQLLLLHRWQMQVLLLPFHPLLKFHHIPARPNHQNHLIFFRLELLLLPLLLLLRLLLLCSAVTPSLKFWDYEL